MKTAAIYARVSSEQQKEENTIASQTAALIEFAHEQGFSVPDEWMIEDAGFSGASPSYSSHSRDSLTGMVQPSGIA